MKTLLLVLEPAFFIIGAFGYIQMLADTPYLILKALCFALFAVCLYGLWKATGRILGVARGANE